MKANKIERAKTYELKVGKNTTQVKVTAIDRNVNGIANSPTQRRR